MKPKNEKKIVKMSASIKMVCFEAELIEKDGTFRSSLRKGYVIQDDSLTCLTCGMTSYNPNDVRTHYCGHCHEFLDACF